MTPGRHPVRLPCPDRCRPQHADAAPRCIHCAGYGWVVAYQLPCAVCDAPTHVAARCQTCGDPVCPAHRLTTTGECPGCDGERRFPLDTGTTCAVQPTRR